MAELESVEHRLCVSPLFQVVLMLCTTVFLLIVMYQPYAAFYPLEPVPTIKALSPDVIKNFGGNPAKLVIGLSIDRFSQFDLLTGKCTFSGTLWFEYDPALIPERWVDHVNLLGADFVHKSEPYTRYLLHDGTMLRYYNVVIGMTPVLIHRRFPFDDHTISFIVSHDYLTPEEIFFESSFVDFVLSPASKTTGWELAGTTVKNGYISTRLSNWSDTWKIDKPATVFAINYSRIGVRYQLSVFLPMLLLFFLTMFSLSLDPSKYFSTIVTMSTGGITGMLAYRFIIESMSPKTDAFTMSDYCFFVVFALMFVVFIFNLFITRCNPLRNKLLLVSLHGALMLSFAYIILGAL